MVNVNPTMSVIECERSKQSSGKTGVCQNGQNKNKNKKKDSIICCQQDFKTLHSRLKEKDGRWGTGKDIL